MYSEKLKQLLTPPEKDPPFVALMANSTSGDIGLNFNYFRNLEEARGNDRRSRVMADDLAARVHSALADLKWENYAELDVRFGEVEIAWRSIEPELLKWAKTSKLVLRG